MYRTFEEVSDTRPLPKGFDKGFNPTIPTKAEVEAVKQKQEAEKLAAAAKNPELIFKEGIKQDEVELTKERDEVSRDAIQEIYETGKLEKNAPRVTALKNKISQGIEDLAISENLTTKGYGKEPRFMAGFNRKMAEFWAMPISQRPPIREYMQTFETNPEDVLDINIDAADFVKNLGEQEYQKAVKNSVGGVTIDKETLLKSKFPNGQVDELTMSAFKADPARMKTIDANRRKSEAATINSLFGKGNKVKARVRSINPDGTENITEQTYTNPEELTQLVTNGEAIPLDSKGRPIQGFEDGFGLLAVDKRNNRVATNYLTTAAGITRKNESSTIIDQDEAGVRDGFGFGIKTRKNIVLDKANESNAVSQFGLAQKMSNAGVPKEDIERLQFESREALYPSVVKDGNSELISIEGINIPTANGEIVDTYIGKDGKPIKIKGKTYTELPKNVKFLSAEPILTNSDGARIIVPDELDEKDKITYLKQRTGTNSRGKMKVELAVNLLAKNEAGELEPIVYRLKDYTDPLWIKYNQIITPASQSNRVRKNAKKQYDDLLAKSRYAKIAPMVVREQDKTAAKNNTPTKKVVAKTEKPKTKTNLN